MHTLTIVLAKMTATLLFCRDELFQNPRAEASPAKNKFTVIRSIFTSNLHVCITKLNVSLLF